MKRIVAALLCLVLFAGCSSPDTADKTSSAADADTSSRQVSSESVSSAVIPEVNEYKEYSYNVEDIADRLLLGNRSIYYDGGIVFDQAGASFSFTADCEGDVKVNILSAGYNANTVHRFYTAYVDGERTNRITAVVASSEEPITITVAEDLPRGVHEIKVHRATPAEYGSETVKSIIMNGVPGEKPEQSELLIEFIGDSITAGLDNLEGEGDAYAPARSDSTQTYSFFTAENLGADYSSVCCGGLPFVIDYNGLPIKARYQRTSFSRNIGDHDFARPADVVVINLGTNDYGGTKLADNDLTDRDVMNLAVELIEWIKQKNPGAKIVWAYGMLGRAGDSVFMSAVQKAGGAEAGVYYCEMPGKIAGESGHPKVESHKNAAKVLTEFLKEEVGITAQ